MKDTTVVIHLPTLPVENRWRAEARGQHVQRMRTVEGETKDGLCAEIRWIKIAFIGSRE